MTESQQTQAEMSGEEVVKTSVRLPKHVHRQLKQYCLDSDSTEMDTITVAIIEFLKNHRAKRSS